MSWLRDAVIRWRVARDFERIALNEELREERSAHAKTKLRLRELADEFDEFKRSVVVARSVGEAVGRTHPAGRDWCPPRGIERTWN